MKTIALIGTDLHGREDWWPNHHPEENPIIDDRRRWDCAHRPSMENQYAELVEQARIDGIAVGLRSVYDDGWPHIPLFSDVAQTWTHSAGVRPATFMPFVDTGSLRRQEHAPDLVFDFANQGHRDEFWTHFLGPYFPLFPKDRWERTPDGRVVILFWSVHPETAHGVTNQSQAQLLLDLITAKMQAAGYGTPAFILDQTWREYAPGLQFYGEHGWFLPERHESFTLRTHNGVTVGLTVPGFIDPPWYPQQRQIDREHGDLFKRNLWAMRHADYIFIESYNNRSECAGLYVAVGRGDRELKTLRDFIRLTRGDEPMPDPEPLDPVDPAPLPGGLMHLAVTTTPILKWTTGVLVDSPLGHNRKALRWTQKPGTNKPEDGYPDATSSKFLCVNPDGTTEAKDAIGEWESSQPLEDAHFEIRWFTQNAGKDQSATVVFGLQQFAA